MHSLTLLVSQETKTQSIVQIEVCVNKSFKVIDCEKHSQAARYLDNSIPPLHKDRDRVRTKRALDSSSQFNMAYNQVVLRGQIQDCWDTEKIAFPTMHHP